MSRVAQLVVHLMWEGWADLRLQYRCVVRPRCFSEVALQHAWFPIRHVQQLQGAIVLNACMVLLAVCHGAELVA